MPRRSKENANARWNLQMPRKPIDLALDRPNNDPSIHLRLLIILLKGDNSLPNVRSGSLCALSHIEI